MTNKQYRLFLPHRIGAQALLLICGLAFFAPQAQAHFLELIPNNVHVTDPQKAEVVIDIAFTHPWAGGPVMTTEDPDVFGVQVAGQKTDLLQALTPLKGDRAGHWVASYTPSQPGDHIFYMQPAPYWEPAEGKTIVHYTKVVVEAFGAAEGWDDLIGFPVEIAPLSRPYGLWTGNAFQGQVLKNNEPVPFAEIEVEYRAGGTLGVPNPAFETQVVKADMNGVFTYVMPKTGWWGFAALVDGKPQPNPAGNIMPTEWGGLIWVKTEPMP